MAEQLPEGKRRDERKVPVPHVPPNVLAELMARPTKNTVEIQRQPFPETRPVTRIEIPPAPVVDVRTLGPMAERPDAGIIQP
jgi:hypothetical protein